MLIAFLARHVLQYCEINRLISVLGSAIALFVAVGLPLGYTVIGIDKIDRELSFRAELSATRASKYIYGHGRLWMHHNVRLKEVIEQTDHKRGGFNQVLTSSAGETIVNEENSLDWPTIGRSAPIIVANKTLGLVTVETSLAPLLGVVGKIILASFLLAAVTFVGLQIIPLASLRKTLGALDAERIAVASSNQKLALALNNMGHGLALYDRMGEVVVENDIMSALREDLKTEPRQSFKFGDLLAALKISDQVTGLSSSKAPAAALDKLPSQFIECVIDRAYVVKLTSVSGVGVLATVDDVTERRLALSKIDFLARFDSLTGLANRAQLQDELESQLKNLEPATKLAVLCIDLDRFKAVNDTLGHPIGDDLLRVVATRLRTVVRRSDIVARLGGDEFAVIQSGVKSSDDIGLVSERILSELAAPFLIQGHSIDISGSIGIALADEDTADPVNLMKQADMALYEAKSSGRNAFRFFERGMDERIQKRHELENDLRRAIVENQFELHYQPLFDLARNAIEGFEALIRWRHPTRGLVSPIDFIPVAEQTGLIKQIGKWVLRQACQDASAWPVEISVAVNLSSVQFTDSSLYGDVVEALAMSSFAPERLELEVTESIILQDTESTLQTLRDFKALGIRIAMDDFGTGYSSLAYLQKFPFDKIKIDRAFIDGINLNKDSLAIVRAVTSLSQSLGIKTTGEGVETEAELACLRVEGCTQAQGYLISKPVPAKAVANLLAKVMLVQIAA
jgi:diguanylate cyclase (GGDEF)-like protein